VTIARRAAVVAQEIGTAHALTIANWMMGSACHHIGDQEGAQRHCELGLKQSVLTGFLYFDLFGYDHRLPALLILARASWLRGFPERAARTAREAIEIAAKRDRPLDACIAMLTASVSLWRGDLDEAAERIDLLVAQAAQYQLGYFRLVGLGYRAELAIACGDASAGVQLIREILRDIQGEPDHVETIRLYCSLAQGLLRSGQLDEATDVIEAVHSRATEREEEFELPRIIRIMAEIELAKPRPCLVAAELALFRSIECARGQSALSLELCAAIPLAQLLARQRRRKEAVTMLSGIYGRFSEGFATVDLMSAARLLDQLKRDS